MKTNYNFSDESEAPKIRPVVKKEAPEGARTPEKRKDIALAIEKMINAGLMEHGSMRKRNERNQKYYNNNPDQKDQGKLPFPNATDHHAPLVQPIIDLIVETVAQPIVEADPYWIVETSGPSATRIRNVEQDLAYLARMAGFEQLVYEACTMAAINGMAMVRVPFEVTVDGFHANSPQTATSISAVQIGEDEFETASISYCGPVLELWHPDETVAYPLAVREINRLRLIGHSVPWRIQEVREYQIAGKFFNDEDAYGDATEEPTAGRESEHDRTVEDLPAFAVDETLNLYAGLVKLDLDGDGIEEIYEFVIAKDQVLLLDLQKYESRIPWYTAVRLHYEHNTFYPASSIATNLQRSQTYYNEMHNILLDGTFMATMPPMFMPRGVGNGEHERYGYGEIRYTDAVPEITSPPVNFNPGPVVTMIQQLKGTAYESAGVGMNDMGQIASSETSATEVVQAASFSNRRTSGYREKLEPALNTIGYLILNHYRDNYELLKSVHGDRLLCSDREELKANYHLKLAGATSTNSPVQQIQSIQMILQSLPQLAQLDPMALKFIDIQQLLKSLLNATKLPQTDAIMRDDESADVYGMILAVRQIIAGAMQQMTGDEQTDTGMLLQAFQQIGQVVTEGIDDSGLGADEEVPQSSPAGGIPQGGGLQPA